MHILEEGVGTYLGKQLQRIVDTIRAGIFLKVLAKKQSATWGNCYLGSMSAIIMGPT